MQAIIYHQGNLILVGYETRGKFTATLITHDIELAAIHWDLLKQIQG